MIWPPKVETRPAVDDPELRDKVTLIYYPDDSKVVAYGLESDTDPLEVQHGDR